MTERTGAPRPLSIVAHDPTWPDAFMAIASALRAQLSDGASRIDHIGSTAVPGLAAKDVIDVQLTVVDLTDTARWPDELLPGLLRRHDIVEDHMPPGSPRDPSHWAKHFWSDGRHRHVHVRQAGRRNQRYPLLFRDYLRADAADAYGTLKTALAAAASGDWDTYYAVKDPACDLILAGAEHWARRTDWSPGPTDA